MHQSLSLDQALPHFQTFLHSRNTSGLTQQAYTTDIRQFIAWLKETTVLELHATSYDEYAKLLSAAGSKPCDFAMLQLLLQTGIRVSELVSLTVSSIDLQARTILNSRQRQERTNHSYWIILRIENPARSK
ncbi:MAG: hypothetical protein NVSMB49_25280 [Ktedonobacteraceae bacterium]